MAHELETLANGQVAFVTARQTAWHQLGTVTETTLDAADILAKAFLGGWRVRKIPLYGIETIDGVETRIRADDKVMTVRTNVTTQQTEYLGVVGDGYGVVQNEMLAEALNRLVDETNGAHFETAGSLRRGKSVFVTMRLPETMRIAGTDGLDLYLAATTGHDGTAAFRLDATPTRMVCANTVRAGLANSVGSYTFRHTSNVTSQIAQAREAIGLMWAYLDEFQQEAERMLDTALTMSEFEKIIAQVWPVKDAAGEQARNNAKKRTNQLRYLIRDADTQAGIRGTRWAGYQAITEYLDHYQPAKNDTARANRVITGDGPQLKTRAFDLLKV